MASDSELSRIKWTVEAEMNDDGEVREISYALTFPKLVSDQEEAKRVLKQAMRKYLEDK